MKLKIILLYLLFVFVNTGWTQELQKNPNPFYKYETTEIKPGVFVINTIIDKTTWVNGNITFIVNENDVLVVDSGFLPEAGELAINEIKKTTTKPVKYLVNTHWHGDHWHGNQAFIKAYPNIVIISSKKGFEEISTRGVKDAKIEFERMFNDLMISYKEELESNENANGDKLSKEDVIEYNLRLKLYPEIIKRLKAMELVLPNLLFEKEMTLNYPNRVIQILHLGAGNTQGDTVVYLPKEKVLISGDVVVYPTSYESGGFSKSWKKVLDKLLELEIEFLVPGHGKVLESNNYLQFISLLFGALLDRLDNMLEKDVLKDGATKIITIDLLKKDLHEMDNFLMNYFENFNPNFIKRAINTYYRNKKQ